MGYEEERPLHEAELLGYVGVSGGGWIMDIKAQGLGGARNFEGCRLFTIGGHIV